MEVGFDSTVFVENKDQLGFVWYFGVGFVKGHPARS
jgi:hypothetical protein